MLARIFRSTALRAGLLRYPQTLAVGLLLCRDVERSKMLAEGKLTGEQRDDDGEIGAPSSAASNFSLKQGDKIKIGLRGKASGLDSI